MNARSNATQQVAKTCVEAPMFRLARLNSAGDRDLAWSCLPEVTEMLQPASALAAVGKVQMVSAYAKNMARAFRVNAGPTLTRVGPALVIDTSIQTTRVTSSVVQELVRRFGEPTPVRLPPLGPSSYKGADQSARFVGNVFKSALSASGSGTPTGLPSELLKVEVLRRRLEGARMSERGIDFVVVASQQNSSTRAVLSVAHRQGMTSYYIPHAPPADNQIYRDLPTNFALLRGDEEVNTYRALGAKPIEHLFVVGVPGATVALGADPPQSAAVVYAPSPYFPEVIKADVAVILEAYDGRVQVSLHPRMREAAYRDLLPGHWDIVDSPDTVSYLRQHGAMVVIQHGSGVGLEALGLGIDVIDLCHVDERPNYHFLRQPHVQIVSDGVGLREALQVVPERVAARTERRDYSRSWCAAEDAAAERVVDTIEATSSPKLGGDPVLLNGFARHLALSPTYL